MAGADPVAETEEVEDAYQAYVARRRATIQEQGDPELKPTLSLVAAQYILGTLKAVPAASENEKKVEDEIRRALNQAYKEATTP